MAQALRIGLLTLTGVLVIGWVAARGPSGHALPAVVVPSAPDRRLAPRHAAPRATLPRQHPAAPRATAAAPVLAQAAALPSPLEAVPPRERSVALGPASIAIPAGSYSFVAFKVTPGLLAPKVQGTVAAHGGGGNDIQIWVLDASQFAAFQAHHLARAYFESDRISSTTVAVGPLPPGDYDVVFSNVFSLFTAKQVSNRLRLTYLETRLENRLENR